MAGDPFGPLRQARQFNEEMAIRKAEENRRQTDWQSERDIARALPIWWSASGALVDQRQPAVAENGALGVPAATPSSAPARVPLTPEDVPAREPEPTTQMGALSAPAEAKMPPAPPVDGALGGGETPPTVVVPGAFDEKPRPVPGTPDIPGGATRKGESDPSFGGRIATVMNDPTRRRAFFDDPDKIQKAALIFLRNGNKNGYEWLKSAYAAEKENAFGAMGKLLVGDARGAREDFDASGELRTAGKDPVKNADGTWTLDLATGQTITLNPQHYLDVMSNPQKYHEEKLKREKTQQEIATGKAHERQQNAAAGMADANAEYTRTVKSITAQQAADAQSERARAAVIAAMRPRADSTRTLQPPRQFSPDEATMIGKAIDDMTHETDADGRRTVNQAKNAALRQTLAALRRANPQMDGVQIQGVLTQIDDISEPQAQARAAAEYEQMVKNGAKPGDPALGGKSRERWISERAWDMRQQLHAKNDAVLQQHGLMWQKGVGPRPMAQQMPQQMGGAPSVQPGVAASGAPTHGQTLMPRGAPGSPAAPAPNLPAGETPPPVPQRQAPKPFIEQVVSLAKNSGAGKDTLARIAETDAYIQKQGYGSGVSDMLRRMGQNDLADSVDAKVKAGPQEPAAPAGALGDTGEDAPPASRTGPVNLMGGGALSAGQRAAERRQTEIADSGEGLKDLKEKVANGTASAVEMRRAIRYEQYNPGTFPKLKKFSEGALQ